MPERRQNDVSQRLSVLILKSWHPSWDPKYFMVDYSTAEISAIESEFPNVAVYICGKDEPRLEKMG